MSPMFPRHISPLAAIALVSPFAGAPALAQAHVFKETNESNGPRATHNLQVNHWRSTREYGGPRNKDSANKANKFEVFLLWLRKQ